MTRIAGEGPLPDPTLPTSAAELAGVIRRGHNILLYRSGPGTGWHVSVANETDNVAICVMATTFYTQFNARPEDARRFARELAALATDESCEIGSEDDTEPLYLSARRRGARVHVTVGVGNNAITHTLDYPEARQLAVAVFDAANMATAERDNERSADG